MACPKGWEALTPLRAPDRATTPLLRDARGKLEPVDWDDARSTRSSQRFKAIQAAHGPRVGRVPRHRPDRRPRRWRCSARSPSSAWAWSTATATRASAWPPRSSPTSRAFGFDAPPYTYADFEESDVHRARRLEPVHRAPDHVGARLPQPAQRPRSSSSIRARPRRRWRRRSTCALAPEVGPGAVLRPGAPADRSAAGSTATFIDAHTSGFDEFARARRAVHARARRARRPACRRGSSSALAAHDRTRASASRSGGRWASTRATRACARAGDHQPRADDRQHRPARHRRELDHRPVQRDGLAPVQQHDQPARRPRLHQRRRTAPRSPASSASTRRASRDRPSLAYDQIIEGILARQDQGPVDRRAPTRRTRGSTRRDFARRARRGSTSSSCRTCTRRPRPRSMPHLVLPAAGWGEKEGTFINSERRIGLRQEGRARAGRGARRLPHLQARRRGLGLRRDVRGVDVARGGVPDPEATLARPAVRHHRHRRLRDARRARRRPVAAARGRACARRAASAACSTTAGSSTPTARARFVFDEPRAAARADRRALSVHAAHRPRQLEPVAHADAHRASRRCCASSYPHELYVEINPVDAARARHRARTTGCVVELARAARSRRAPSSTHVVQPGQVFMPMHYDDDQPADVRGVRPVLAPALVQALRRAS